MWLACLVILNLVNWLRHFSATRGSKLLSRAKFSKNFRLFCGSSQVLSKPRCTFLESKDWCQLTSGKSSFNALNKVLLWCFSTSFPTCSHTLPNNNDNTQVIFNQPCQPKFLEIACANCRVLGGQTYCPSQNPRRIFVLWKRLAASSFAQHFDEYPIGSN